VKVLPGAMTSKQRVLAALNHQEPDRVPVDFHTVPEQVETLCRYFGLERDDPSLVPPTGDYVDAGLLERLDIDVRTVWPKYTGPPIRRAADGTFVDFWGVPRRPVRNQTGVYNEVIQPPLGQATSAADVARHAWPRLEWFDFSVIGEQSRHFQQYAVVSGWPGNVDFINRTATLCGYERVLTGLATGDAVVLAVFDTLIEFFLAYNRRCYEAGQGGIDIAFHGDDLGSQMGPLISSKMYRDIFRPRWAPIIELDRAFGLKIMLHSCGGTRKLMPELVDTGFDAIQTIQPEARGMDLAGLKAEFGEHLAFDGAISVQQVLPSMSPDGVRAEVERVIQIMAPGGGYILGPSHNIQTDTSIENILAMYGAARQAGRYPIDAG
jgi:uroporphyrinogen decarboxylase